jgi:hypothetical protein
MADSPATERHTESASRGKRFSTYGRLLNNYRRARLLIVRSARFQ